MKHSLRGPNGRFIKSDHPSAKKKFVSKEDLIYKCRFLSEENYTKDQMIEKLKHKLDNANVLNFICVSLVVGFMLFSMFIMKFH